MTFDEYATARLPALLRYAAVLAGDQDLAQDIVQEVLARAHTRWHKIVQLEAPDLYVRRMVTNEFISWRRRWGRVVPVAEVVPAQGPVPDAAAVHAEREALLAELARLPRRQQAVLVLRYYEGLTDAEIAERLGCRPVTVRGDLLSVAFLNQSTTRGGHILIPYGGLCGAGHRLCRRTPRRVCQNTSRRTSTRSSTCVAAAI